MGKKKFIDKKNSATFHLLSRDTTAESAADGPPTDRIFVRVDNNPYSVTGLDDNADDTQHHHVAADDPDDSIFADAPDDTDDDEDGTPWTSPAAATANAPPRPGTLPDNVRRQILELGLPDDGYNYLLHLREIKNAGGGSAYYENPKARFDLVPVDVKFNALIQCRSHREALIELVQQKDIVGDLFNQLRLALQRRTYNRPAQTLAASNMDDLELTERMQKLLIIMQRLDEKIAPMLEEDGEYFNRRWGYLCRAGLWDKSHLTRQIEKYADIYTSRVSNFLHYTPFVYFRSQEQTLAHDSDSYCSQSINGMAVQDLH